MDKKRRTELDMEEEFELILGPHANGSVFESDAARRAAWEEHRNALMADHPPGVRPIWAARQYDDPDPGEDAAPWGPGAGGRTT